MNFWNFDIIPRNTSLMVWLGNYKKHTNEILKATKHIIQKSNFIFLTRDEVITMDNTSWASVHGYIVQD
jgi:hypothetical protein